MKKIDVGKFIVLCLCSVIQLCCNETPDTIQSTYKYISPAYKNIRIMLEDSIHFPLSENTYNEIKSFNYFVYNGKEYMSFYDGRSASINIYDFHSRIRVKKIKLKKWFKEAVLHKTSVFTKNFDSIYITNNKTIYLYDGLGRVKGNIEFNKRTDQYAFFDNPQPPVFKENNLYVGVRPYVSETSFKDQDRWRLMYRFNLRHEAKEMYYSLPGPYKNNLYGFNFFNYSYCFNNKGNFVFSFPADTNIYESNLTDLHMSYYGKSRFQTDDIKPVSKEALKKGDAYREFRLRDSYGPIYYDPFTHRYLRLARQKISEKELSLKNGFRKQSLIIFDDQFRIIGECPIHPDISVSTLFFTESGNMYARIELKDEYALNFVHLVYDEPSDSNKLLTHK